MLNLNISVSETLKQVYATSALHCFMCKNKETKPALLTPDRRASLHLLIRDSFRFVIVGVLPRVITSSTSIDDDDEILSVSMDINADSCNVPTIINITETAIAYYTLHLVYVNEDLELAREYGIKAEEMMKKLRDYITGICLKNATNVTSYSL